ncbi:MAG: DsrE family protein [Saccharospirillaceae bacterium]|nr:DsrE family protein [Saccharospirillaceae bacterium]MCD8531696.1 DsrE family protein [Saccharospirillaceae bacterium]
MIRSAPTAEPEALEMAMALAAFEHSVSLIFQGAGIFWLLNAQEARKAGGKSPAKLISALPMYDCDTLFYAEEDLQALNLQPSQLSPLATPLSAVEIPGIISNAHHCLSF